MIKKISVEHLEFHLCVKTMNRRTLSLPAIGREENYAGDGGLTVFFSPFHGIPVKGFALEAHFIPGVTTVVENPEDVNPWGCAGILSETDSTIDVNLTPKQLKRIVAELNTKLRKANKHAA